MSIFSTVPPQLVHDSLLLAARYAQNEPERIYGSHPRYAAFAGDAGLAQAVRREVETQMAYRIALAAKLQTGQEAACTPEEAAILQATGMPSPSTSADGRRERASWAAAMRGPVRGWTDSGRQIDFGGDLARRAPECTGLAALRWAQEWLRTPKAAVTFADIWRHQPGYEGWDRVRQCKDEAGHARSFWRIRMDHAGIHQGLTRYLHAHGFDFQDPSSLAPDFLTGAATAQHVEEMFSGLWEQGYSPFVIVLDTPLPVVLERGRLRGDCNDAQLTQATPGFQRYLPRLLDQAKRLVVIDGSRDLAEPDELRVLAFKPDRYADVEYSPYYTQLLIKRAQAMREGGHPRVLQARMQAVDRRDFDLRRSAGEVLPGVSGGLHLH